LKERYSEVVILQQSAILQIRKRWCWNKPDADWWKSSMLMQ